MDSYCIIHEWPRIKVDTDESIFTFSNYIYLYNSNVNIMYKMFYTHFTDQMKFVMEEKSEIFIFN